jgi:phosphoglycolate phosphatase-like HAD superfamily hydrolase
MISHVVFDHDETLVNTQDSERTLYAGIAELLVNLRKANIHCYVWTARNRYSTLQSLKNLEILGHFDDISTATDTIPKPHIAGLQSMLSDVDPMEVMVVGDSFTDILGAKKFGAIAVGAVWSDNKKIETLEHCGADYICKFPEEILNIAKRISHV